MMLNAWAARWGVPPAALAELSAVFTPEDNLAARETGTEAWVQGRVRYAHQRTGGRLWRNNVGAYYDETSKMQIRYGLCNDSKALNQQIKSSDLIGITPLWIRPEHVGGLAGIFTSYEIKHSGWTYGGAGREAAQLKWLQLVASLGGIARFAQDEKDVIWTPWQQ